MNFLERFRVNRELEEEVLRLRREIRSLERTERRTEATSATLLAVARALRDARSIEAFADAALLAVIEVADGASGALVVPDEEGTFRTIAARTLEGLVPPETFVLSSGIVAEAAREGHPIATGSAAEDPRFREFASVKEYGIGSILCLPVRRRAGPPGCLYLTGGDRGLRRADPAELLAVADLLSIGLDRLAFEAEATRRERLEAVGLAAASIAHDLRNPLQATDLVLEAVGSTAPAAAPLIESARKTIARVREIAQGLAFFGRGTERALELVPLPIPALIEEHLSELGPVLGAARVRVERALAYEGAVLADRSSLLRVLANVAKNAAEAMEGGGRLEYRSALVAPAEAEIVLADEGPGIPPDRLRRLFRPFETFGKKDGCGLGLALARDLVRAMKGDIRIDSPPGRGAAVSIRLGTPG